MKKWLSVAEKAYQAYGDKVQWKDQQGDLLPKWEDLPRTFQEAWAAACEAAVRQNDAITKIITFHTA